MKLWEVVLLIVSAFDAGFLIGVWYTDWSSRQNRFYVTPSNSRRKS